MLYKSIYLLTYSDEIFITFLRLILESTQDTTAVAFPTKHFYKLLPETQ